MHDEEVLIDQIYEAAAIPELWPGVLDQLTELGDGAGALLFAANATETRWLATPAMADGFAEYVRLGWPARTDRAQRLFAKRHAGFLDDLDVYTADELESEPVFVEFLRPSGIGRGVATAIPITTGDNIVISIERDYRRGSADRRIIDRLDRLRPHLARAALLSARLKFKEAVAAGVALEMVGIPAGVLQGRRLMAPNRMLQTLVPEVVIDRRERVSLVDAEANGLLARAVEQLELSALPTVSSIPIRATGGRPAYIVHLLPVRRAVHDVFSGASAILLVTPVVPASVPDADLLQDLFDLTGAEARIARAVGEQMRTEDIAAMFGVSRETVRTQIKSVLSKTGVQRQIDLAVLLAAIFVPK